MDLVVSCSLTRTSLTLPALQLQAPGAYRVVSAGPGSRTWRRNRVAGLYTDGAVLVTAVKDMSVAPLVVRCEATSAAQLDVNVAALLRAVEQLSYSLTLVIDGVSRTWACEPADYAPVEEEYDKLRLMQFQQVYRLQIPRQPVPSAGTAA
jgi:hypothetical protein